MKKLFLTFFIFAVILPYGSTASDSVTCRVNNIRVNTSSVEDCNSIEGKVESTYHFVINFDTGSFDGKKLQLNGNGTSNVIYFSDSPQIKDGHMNVNKFKSIWDEEINSFKSNHPEAKLSLVIDGKDSNSMMTLSNPEINVNSIIFDVNLMENTPPETFNTGGLFFELLGSYSGPISIYPQLNEQ